jgi:ATP-binding cassette subfamily C protein
MGLPAAVIYLFIRGKSEHLGSEIQDVTEQNTKVMLAGIGGIKELKVLGRESHFLDEYWRVQNRWRDLYTRFILYKTVPRILIELGGVVAVLVVCAVFAAKGDIDHLIPILGLYAAAAFRLLPSIHQLLLALTVIHHNMSGLSAIAEDLRDAAVEQPYPADSPGAQPTVSKEPLQTIEIQDLCFKFAEGLPLVINGLNLTIRAGETVGVVGRSGTGKSTLVDILLGLLEPSRGRILINNRDIAHDLREWQRRVGYVPQSIYLVDESIRRNVCLGMRDDIIEEDRVWQALSAAQLRDFVASLPQGLDTIVGERGVKLSGGQRQRIGIARALYGRPEVLVFDEATSALDNATEVEFMRAIDGLHGQMTIVLVAHRLTTLQNTDKIFIIDNGRVQVSSYEMLMGKASKAPASMAQ